MISYLLFSIYCSSILSSSSATYSFRDIVHTEFVCHLNISNVGCQKINITIEFVCMKSKFSGRLERMNGGIRNMEYGIQNSKWYENIKYKKKCI